LARPHVAVPGLLVIAGVLYLGYQGVERDRKVGWARDVALPEISRLTDAWRLLEAFDLAAEAERYLPEDAQALAELRPLFSRTATIRSDPPGATVWWKDYAETEPSWRPLGQTPSWA
jgi:hypothetical protein